MKKSNLYKVLTVICLTGTFANTSAQSPTAPALGFNVFLEKGAKLSNNETEGPVAMGGDLTLAGAYQVSTNYTGTYTVSGVKVTLLIGGRVIYQSGNSFQVNQNGYVKIGDSTGSYVWYKDQNNAYSPIRITKGQNYNSSPLINLQANSQQLGVSATNKPVFQGGLIDFAAAFNQMKANATSLSACTDNTNLTTPNGVTLASHTGLPSQVKINLHTGSNVLNLNGAELNNVQNFTYNNKPDASHVLIINVNAAGTFNWNVWNSGGIGFNECPYIIYNFYNTTTLNIQGNGSVEGTIFAPYADITKTVNQANVEGQVIAQSYYQHGGENHYAIFTPSAPGCILATQARFGLQSATTQCLPSNSFVFSNVSAGSGSLTYLWEFGDGSTSTASSPSKSYSAAGTYNVKLTVTALGGSASMSINVHVIALPDVGFTINDSIQYLTGNNFQFTPTGNTSGNSYSWDFGDGSTSSSFNPGRAYNAIGLYHVIQHVTGPSGCMDSSRSYVVVACDSVGSGDDGGLESESLGGLVVKRDYQRIKNGLNKTTNYAAMSVFTASTLKAATTELQLADMVPDHLLSGDVPRVSTPLDLLNLTSALDVLGVDYTLNNQNKGVVLGIKTAGKPYSHTKAICDRMRGARLVSVEQTVINGYSFVLFTLKQENGTFEYAISFAAGTQSGRPNYTLQTNWLVHTYLADEFLYTFQVWAARPDYSRQLVKDILDKLSGYQPLDQVLTPELPLAYITHGYRNKENLIIQINNQTAASSGKLVFDERQNEQAAHTVVEVPITLVKGSNNLYSIPVKDGYEYEGEMYLDNKLVDRVYLADGNWGLDYDAQFTTVSDYSPANEPNRVYSNHEFPVYRSVSLKASTSDYISLYKAIKPGTEKADLTTYGWLNFFAKGKGMVEIRLTKESIVGWTGQYRTTVTLDENGKNYSIPFSSFVSSTQSGAFVPNDVKILNFAFVSGGGAQEVEFSVSDVAFGKTATGISKIGAAAELSVYPNPNRGNFSLNFTADHAEDMEVVVTDIMGKVVYTQMTKTTTGINSVQLNLPEVKGVLFVSIHAQSKVYDAQKVVIR